MHSECSSPLLMLIRRQIALSQCAGEEQTRKECWEESAKTEIMKLISEREQPECWPCPRSRSSSGEDGSRSGISRDIAVCDLLAQASRLAAKEAARERERVNLVMAMMFVSVNMVARISSPTAAAIALSSAALTASDRLPAMPQHRYRRSSADSYGHLAAAADAAIRPMIRGATRCGRCCDRATKFNLQIVSLEPLPKESGKSACNMR